MPTVLFLTSFAEAWNDREIDGPMMHMADECVFISSGAGRSKGVDAVRTGFASDGTVIEEKGCDNFTFQDGKIFVKDTYLK
jgi:ketosteroid isomerase-like protein